MRLVKPQPDTTIRITAKDMATGESKTTTLYDTTPEEVIAAIETIATIRGDKAAQDSTDQQKR